MHKSQSLINLTTALHVSGVTITHLQEHKTTVTTASGNRYTVLLSTAIVEEMEPVIKITYINKWWVAQNYVKERACGREHDKKKTARLQTTESVLS